MSALDQVKERASVPMLKDTINAALHAHAQVPTALVSDLVHVPAASLYSSCRRNSAQAASRMPLLRLAFCRTFLPGLSTVPLALADIAATRRSSIAMTAC